MMKQFRLLKQSVGETITKFFVYNSAGDTIGSINVPNEDADDLERHWLQPQAAAPTKKGALVAAMEEHPGSLPPDHARQKENPAGAAMVRAAPKNRLSQAAILRGC